MIKTKGIKWIKYEKIKSLEEEEDHKDFFESEKNSNSDSFELPDPTDHLDFTPFGEFPKDSPLNPHNMYDDMYWGHMIGKSINDPDFFTNSEPKSFALDYVEGVATWRPIDPYTIFVVPAKYYDWNVVRQKIEQALKLEPDSEDNQIIQKCHSMSANLNEEHFVLAIPEYDRIISSDNSKEDYFKRLEEALEIFEKEQNVYMIINGEISRKN